MKAGRSLCHDFDFCRLPKEAVIIKIFYKYSYEQVDYILEHKYQIVRNKQPDGEICKGYLSKDGGLDYMDVVPVPTYLPISWPMRAPSSCMRTNRTVI